MLREMELLFRTQGLSIWCLKGNETSLVATRTGYIVFRGKLTNCSVYKGCSYGALRETKQVLLVHGKVVFFTFQCGSLQTNLSDYLTNLTSQ